MACCSASRAKAKKIAIRKATLKANHLAKIGKLAQPKPTKTKAKKVPGKKVKPCTLCGQARRNR